PAEDVTITAKWKTRQYTLTFIDHNGGKVYGTSLEWGALVEDEYYTANGKVEENNIITGPFQYEGWYDQSDTEKTIIEDFSELKMPTRDLTYVLKLRLMDSAIGEFTVNTPADFTFTESNTAEFSVMPNEGTTLYAGVTYKYIWTINKDNVIYKTEETTESSLTLQNLAAGEYLANVKIVASMENCGSVEKDFSADKTLTVSRADISGITVTGVTMTYGDKTAKIGMSGLLADDIVTYGTDGATFPLQNVDLSVLDYGEHDYYVRVYRGDNYNPYTSDKITVKIDKAEVTATVTPDNATLTYGNTLPSLTATINGETYTIESGKYELHFGYTKITGNVANNVGTYNIGNVDISVLRAKYPEKNYNIALTTVGTIKINEADLTVTIDKINPLTYGDDLPKITYTFSELKLSDKESDFTVSIDTKYKKKADAGDYTLTAKVSGDKTEFYNITVNTVKFKVNKRAATITVNKVDDIVYGSEEPPKLEATVKDVLDGDKLVYSLTTTYTDKALVGTCEVNVSVDKVADVNKNYDVKVAYTNKTFQVTPRDLTIKLNNTNTATIAVGKTYKVEAEHLEKIGLVAGDTVTGHVTITKDVKGTYYADDFDKFISVKNAKGDYVTECYEIAYEMSVEFVEVGDFAIDFTTKPVTYDGQPHGVLVTKTDATKNYTITYGESAENCNLEESPKYTNAGAYPIYFKVVDNKTQADYAGSVTLTINKKAVEIKVNDVEITYKEKIPAFSCTVTGFVNGETHSVEAVYTVKTLSGEEVNIGAGTDTDAGEYVISVSEPSAGDNYTVTTVKPGKLTINKISATVTWTNAENRVYSPDGQTLPTATYDGKTANLKFTKGGKVCEFKNAGEYKVTVADNNYILTNNEKTIVIEKATYDDPALSLTGIHYDPNKTLGKDYEIEGITWVNPDEVPVCTKKKYDAIYNKDPANYNDKETKVTLDLQKATVTLAQNLFEFNFDGASHEIKAVVTYNGVALDTSLYSLTYDGKTSKTYTDAGTHRTLVTMEADNYDLPKNTYVYVKVKGVKVGNNYYTIEDALAVAKEGQTIFVLNDTAFATQEIAGVLYNDVNDVKKFKTVKTGVTLLLPFNENDTVGHIGAGDKRSANYKATAALTGNAKLYKTLVIPEGIEVIVNGKLVVGAQTGTTAAGGVQNGIRGNYCEISLGGTITLNNATLEVYGYIKGNGEITANNTTVIENLCITGWLGGSESAGRYIGDGKLLTSSTNVKNPVQFPFSHYELRSVQLSITLHKGSKHQGYAKIATGDSLGGLIAAQINEAWLTFVSSDSNESSGLVRMKSSDAKVVKTFKGGRVGIETYGSVEDGYTSVTLEVGVTISMTSEKVFFPICGKTDIVIKSGTFTQKYKYKWMPGSTLTIENGATFNQNGSIVVYTGDFKDVTDTHYPSGLGDARCTVDGTLNINGAFGGKVLSTTAGKVVVGANATITDVYSPEGKGGVSGLKEGMKTQYTPLDKAMTTKSLEFVNAGNSTVAAETNKTYNYNNGTWQ
ncbi:MAG: MBG domain-containing protein, partial [Eubacteriales bacterium]|nr:MBG domain-containing protein [Eubacteriales bacterium]